MSNYLAWTLYAQLDGTNWTDISADVVGSPVFSGKRGILGNGPTDRTAQPGELVFYLNNSATNSGGVMGYYSPDHTSCRTGFTSGLLVKLIGIFDGRNKLLFYGRIPPYGIEPIGSKNTDRKTKVVVMDWFEQAYIHELQAVEYTTDKRGDQVAALILADMTIQPMTTDLLAGEDTFGAVFDTTRATTKAATELQKLTLSEQGYAYLRNDGTIEALRFEGRYHRVNNVGSATPVPVYSADAGAILLESGGTILLESGGTLRMDEYTSVNLDNEQSDIQATSGKLFYNRIKCTAYPRSVDGTATTVLFSLSSPQQIGAGQTITMTGRYRDPNGGASQVSGIDMQAPAGTTDYLMNSARDGSGTNLTSYLTVTPTYSTGSVAYQLTNSGASAGYITKLQARGKGVYIYDPVDYTAEGTATQAVHGPYQLDMDMKYQDNVYIISGFAEVLLLLYNTPRTTLEKVTVNANRSTADMLAFMTIEPGDRIHIKEDLRGIDSDFFVHGIEFEISQPGIVKFSWYVRECAYDTYSYDVWDSGLWDDALWAF